MQIKTIKFRGQVITVEEARAMVAELAASLASADPVATDSPVGQQILTIQDPRWYTELNPSFPGSLLSFRDPGLGWRGFTLPWVSVADLVGLLTKQMALAATTERSEGPLH